MKIGPAGKDNLEETELPEALSGSYAARDLETARLSRV
jgi:hypothetical protein